MRSLTPIEIEIIERMFSRYLVPLMAPGGPGVSEDTAREWTRKTISTLKARTGNLRLCTKRAGPGRPASKDVMAEIQSDGTLIGWDLLLGTGTGSPILSGAPWSSMGLPAPQEAILTGPEAADEIDHLLDGPVPVPGPGPVLTPPPSDLTAVLREIAALASNTKRIREVLEQVFRAGGPT